MSKRANQEGTIYESPKDSGKWWAQLPPDEYGKRPKRRANSQKDARQLLRLMEEERARGGNPSDRYPFLDEELQHWLVHTKQPEIAAKTYQSYEQTIRLYINAHLPRKGHIRINELRAKHIEKMRNTILETKKKLKRNGEEVEVPLSTRTAQLAVVVLTQALDVMVERYHLPRNEAKLVKPLKRVKSTFQPLTVDQIGKLLEAVEGHRLKLLYHIALTYGFRKGEVLGLLWSDLDLEKRTIRVSGTLQELKGGKGLVRKPSPKSDAGFRTLPLTDDLAEMAKAHLQAMQLEYQEREQPWPEDGPVFSSEAGSWIWPRNFTTHFKAILRHAGLPETTRVHDLRHTMVSTMLNEGQPLSVVSKYVGHSSVSVTADIYGHRDAGAEKKVAEAMQEVMRRRKKEE